MHVFLTSLTFLLYSNNKILKINKYEGVGEGGGHASYSQNAKLVSFCSRISSEAKVAI